MPAVVWPTKARICSMPVLTGPQLNSAPSLISPIGYRRLVIQKNPLKMRENDGEEFRLALLTRVRDRVRFQQFDNRHYAGRLCRKQSFQLSNRLSRSGNNRTIAEKLASKGFVARPFIIRNACERRARGSEPAL